MRRDDREGMEVDNFLETLDGSGTGVALGERAGVVSFKADLTVVLPLASVLSEALDGLLDFLRPDNDVLSDEERVVDLERRVDVSDGVETPFGSTVVDMGMLQG